MNLVFQANRLLTGQGFMYAICGGQAIDLFLGYTSRTHGDIDILAFWPERDRVIAYMQSRGYTVFEPIGGGQAHLVSDIADQRQVKRNIFCIAEGCELVRLAPAGERGIYNIDFLRGGQPSLRFVEFLFNHKTDTHFLYARDHSIIRELDRAILQRGGVPYLSPELCLLYKSTDTAREGYQQDFELAVRAMNQEQKEWLNCSLRALFPHGHPWLHS